jgi:NADH-quinone oxidoreductase subunit N
VRRSLTGNLNFPGLRPPPARAVMILVGFGFKLGSAPFHLWTPDVYRGRRTIVTGLMGSAPEAWPLQPPSVWLYGELFHVPSEGVGTAAPSGLDQLGCDHSAHHDDGGQCRRPSQKNVKRMLAYSIDRPRRLCADRGSLTGDSATVLF